MTVLRSASGGGGNAHVPEYNTDPASPNAGDLWVLRSVSGGAGGGVLSAIAGLGFPIITAGIGGATTYQLSYRTEAGTTKRVTLS